MVYEWSEVRETVHTAQRMSVIFARRKREGRNIATDLELTRISIHTIGETVSGLMSATRKRSGALKIRPLSDITTCSRCW
jgi:hypothetical protein